MNYKGVIIEESLENKDMLKEVRILDTKIEKVTDEHQTPWLKQWTLHTVEITEENAASVAEKISKALDSGHGGSWYADFKNNTHHYIIFRKKVFFIDRNSKEQYGEAKQYGLSLGIPEYQLINYRGLPFDVLAHFLNEANKNTYTNRDAPKASSSRLKSEDYHFEKDDLVYHDTYFGGRDFIGEEIVYKDSEPVWGANYFGSVLDDAVNEKDVYDFLRKALMQEYQSLIPVRGPSDFQSGNWNYKFSVNGDLSNFSGQEEILFNNKVVYRCLIHGGFIESLLGSYSPRLAAV